MGPLPRPSRDTLLRAKAPSGHRRRSAKQHALPRAARAETYDIPDTPEQLKIPKLRRPRAQALDFSPLRPRQKQQPAASTVQPQDTLANQAAVEDHETAQELHSTADLTHPRRSSRAQATIELTPAEKSVGGAKRHALPSVPAKENDENADSPIVSPRRGGAVVVSTAAPATPLKRGRSPKEVGSRASRKSAGLAKNFPHEYGEGHGEPEEAEPVRRTYKSAKGKGPLIENQDMTRAKPTKIRLSELGYPVQTPTTVNSGGKDESAPNGDPRADEEQDEDVEQTHEAQASTASQKSKVQRVPKRTEAAKLKRKSTTALPKVFAADEELHDDSGRGVEDDGDSLGQQYIVVKNIYTNVVPKVEAMGDGELLDATIDELRLACRSFRQHLRQLRESPDDAELLSGLPRGLETVRSQVEVLCEENADRERNRLQSQSIYFCLFPALVRVLWSLIRCYKALDLQKDTDGMSVTITHVKDIKRFTGTILKLGDSAKRYVRPQIVVVRDVTRGILVPLRKVHNALQREVFEYDEERQREQREARHAQAREAAELETAHAKAEKARWQTIQEKWSRLHVERKLADECIIPLAKRRHLCQPSAEPEQDQNGERFTRVEVFRPRVGPQPGLVNRIKSQVWPRQSQTALVEGLMTWAGDALVFERIFRAYCGRNGPLNPYNVTEIVVQAALLKHVLEPDCDPHAEDTAWVAQIPDWTKPDVLMQQLQAPISEGGSDVDSC